MNKARCIEVLDMIASYDALRMLSNVTDSTTGATVFLFAATPATFTVSSSDGYYELRFELAAHW